MKKNIKLTLLSFVPLIMPLSTISCKGPNAIKKYKDIPEDLINEVKNNYDIFYAKKLENNKLKTTSYEVLDRLKKANNDLKKIEEIISPYAYLNFKYIDQKKYKYELDIEKTKAFSNTLKLVFKVTNKKDNISHNVEYELKNFKKDVSKVNSHIIGETKFYETVTELGETISSKEFISNFKKYGAKYKDDVEKQLEYFKKYCQVDDDFDFTKYDLEFDLQTLHDHGPSNIHIKIRYKLKTESKWKEEYFFVYGFNSSTKKHEFSLKAKKEANSIKSSEFLNLLKTKKTWDQQKELIKKYFNFIEDDDYKYFDYEIDFKNTYIPKRKVSYEDPKQGWKTVEKELDDEENTKYFLNLAIKKIDKFDKTKYKILNFSLNEFGKNTYLGYLDFNELKNDTSYFNISNNELKNELKKEDFKKLSNEKQIEKLVSLLNKGFQDKDKPVNILEKLKDKYEMQIDHTFEIEIGKSLYFTFTWIKIKFLLKNKKTGEVFEKIMTINGLNY